MLGLILQEYNTTSNYKKSEGVISKVSSKKAYHKTSGTQFTTYFTVEYDIEEDDHFKLQEVTFQTTFPIFKKKGDKINIFYNPETLEVRDEGKLNTMKWFCGAVGALCSLFFLAISQLKKEEYSI